MNRLNTALIRILALTASVTLLGGCNSLPEKTQSNTVKTTEDSRPLPFNTPPTIEAELDDELLFSYLVGELGAKDKHFSIALKHYLYAATVAQDAYAAERATRIAAHINDTENGLKAAAVWVKLAPNNLHARRLSLLLHLRDGAEDKAFEQLLAAHKIASALDKDPFRDIATTLAHDSNRTDARPLLKTAASTFADDHRAQFAHAMVLAKHRSYDAAELALRSALAIQPSWSDAHILLAEVLLANKQPLKARNSLRQALTETDDPLIRHAFARLLMKQKEYESALKEFDELQKSSADNRSYTYARAILASQLERHELARKLWQQLRSVNEYHAEASYFLAQTEEHLGNNDVALGLYDSIRSNTLQVDAAIRAGNLLASQNRFEEARTKFAQARRTHKKRALDLYLAETQILQTHHADKALILTTYQDALGKHPESNDLLYQRGLYYSEIALYQAMESDFQTVISRDGKHVNALNALGYTLADRGVRLDEAVGYIERALELAPDNGAILDSMGWAQYRLGNLELAQSYLERALALEPDHEIAAHLGEVLWVRGQQEEARNVWKRALSHTPDSKVLHATIKRLEQQ